MRCRMLKGFYTADWYKDYKNHTSVEIWGRYNEETDEIVDFQIRIHQSAVDSCSTYKTLEEVEKIYEDRKEHFSKEYSNVEQIEKVTERYEKLVKVTDMKKKVHFIGSGYESVKFVIVKAETNGEAFRAAEEWYKSTNQTFNYLEMEVAKCL